MSYPPNCSCSICGTGFNSHAVGDNICGRCMGDRPKIVTINGLPYAYGFWQCECSTNNIHVVDKDTQADTVCIFCLVKFCDAPKPSAWEALKYLRECQDAYTVLRNWSSLSTFNDQYSGLIEELQSAVRELNARIACSAMGSI